MARLELSTRILKIKKKSFTLEKCE